MKEENKIGEITFENIIQLREILEEAWNRGRLEQSIVDLEKDKKQAQILAKKLGLGDLKQPKSLEPQCFQQWFLEIIKRITIK